MVDREARDKMAEALRHFVAGRTTHVEFSAQIPATRDRAVGEAQFLDIECGDHRLGDDYPLAQDQRNAYLRWMLFLYTDIPYQWPLLDDWRSLFALPLAALAGLAAHALSRSVSWLSVAAAVLVSSASILWSALWMHRRSQKGPWPFHSRSEYEEVLKHPRLLAGDG